MDGATARGTNGTPGAGKVRHGARTVMRPRPASCPAPQEARYIQEADTRTHACGTRLRHGVHVNTA
eukprot:scaffold130888_cov63-Phaeocystis_antarctica.AAC.6